MSEEFLETTIANPFANRDPKKTHNKRTFTPAKRQPIVTRPVPGAVVIPPVYQPTYYVSQASRNYVALQLQNQTLTNDEVELIYEIALCIGKVFKRPSPTISDIETATRIRTLEYARKIAAGEEQLDIIWNAEKIMPKNERISFWKTVTERLLTEYDKRNPPNPAQSSQ